MDASARAEAPDIPDPTTAAQSVLNHQPTRLPTSDDVPAPRTQSTELVGIPASSPPYPIGVQSSKVALDSQATSDYESLYSDEKAPAGGSATPDDCEQPMLVYEMSADGQIRLAPSRRFNFRLAVPALLVSLIAAGAASALLWWLLSHRFHHDANSLSERLSQVFTGKVLVTAESDTSGVHGLFFSSLAARLVSLTTPFVLGVFAYYVADTWLQEQMRGNTHAIPTPYQYARLLGLFCSFGLSSVFGKKSSSKKVAVSKTLKIASRASRAALFIGYALSVSDFWLHTMTTSFPRTEPIPSSLLPVLGSRINTSLCPGPVPFMGSDSDRYSNCQHRFNDTGSMIMQWGTPDLMNEGAAVFSNTSLVSQVSTLPLGEFYMSPTVLLPKTLPSNVRNVMFNSFAIWGQCVPIPDCRRNTYLPGTNDFYDIACMAFTPPFTANYTSALSMMTQFNMSSEAYELIFQSGTPSHPRTSVGPLGNGSAPAGYALNSYINPAGVLLALYWELETDTETDTEGPNLDNWAGAYVMQQGPTKYIYYITHCLTVVSDVILSYDSDTGFALLVEYGTVMDIGVPESFADFNKSSALLAALDPAYSPFLADSIATNLEPFLYEDNATLFLALEKLVMQGLLSYAAPLTERIPSINGTQVIGTLNEYPIAALCLVLILTYGYALLALGVGVAVLKLSSRVFTLEADRDDGTAPHILELDLVQKRLTSARACVADRFDGANASELAMLGISWETKFQESPNVRRLGAGFGQPQAELGNDEKKSAIGWKRNKLRFKIDTLDHLHDTVTIAAGTRVVDMTVLPPDAVQSDTSVDGHPASHSEGLASRQKAPGRGTNTSDECEQPMLGYRTGMAPNDDIWLAPARRLNPGFGFAFPALSTSLISAGIASRLLGWLLSHRVRSPWSDPAFRNALVVADNSSNTYGLTLSSVLAQWVGFSMPFVLGVFAYYLAYRWLQDQIHGKISSLPTPTQYGHLFGLCFSFGLQSVFDTAKYLWRPQRAASSKTLNVAFLASLAALLTTYAVSVSDLWLHYATTSFSDTVRVPFSQLPLFGSRIDTGLCPGPTPFVGNGSDRYSNCQHHVNDTNMVMQWGTTDLMNEGSTVFGNFSEVLQVWSLDNGAILIPKTLPNGCQDLRFHTFAVDAYCTAVTDCHQNMQLPGTSDAYDIGCLDFTPPLALNYTSAVSTMNHFNVTNGQLIFESGTPTQPRARVGHGNGSVPAGYVLHSGLNPAGVIVALYWESQSDALDSSTNDHPGTYVVEHGPVEYIYQISTCNVTVLDVVLSYNSLLDGSSRSFTTVNRTLADFNTTSALLAALDPAYSPFVADAIATKINPLVPKASSTFLEELQGLVAQGILGYASPLTQRIAPISGHQTTIRTVNRYPLGPLCLVLGLTYGYAILAFFLGLGVLNLPSRELTLKAGRGHAKGKPILELDLVHKRLTDACACVADIFDGGDASEPVLGVTPRSTFHESKNVKRLGAGFVQPQHKSGNPDVESLALGMRHRPRFKIDTLDHLQD
ncbi:hypothetical protein DFH06DRAFT_1324634 [Mycena polygramma]|nr:hypothetical protein DFH06DRAFT_1324634 [Mycena polygramma]